MKKLLLILPLLALCGCASTVDHIPNFKKVSAGLWRGGQPDDVGWAHLLSLGVSNVVKLNEFRGNIYVKENIDSQATALGMEVLGDEIDFPTQAFLHNQVFLPAEVESAVLYIKTHPVGTYVHCEHGQDRTGLICAVYRVEVEGWSKDAAEKEMLANGFHRELYGLSEFWKQYK